MTAVKTLPLGLVIALTAGLAARADSWSTTGVSYSSFSSGTDSGSSGLFGGNGSGTGGQAASTFAGAPSAPIGSGGGAPPATPTTEYDAYLNLGVGPYTAANTLTTGGAQPWYDSQSASQAFGHTPSQAEQAGFEQAVMADVQATFQKSGLNISLTDRPGDPAAHSLSVVSGTSYAGVPGAVGITSVGYDGFSFIDKLNYAHSPEELEWAVAHNVAHELMHAFGGGHHDTTGQYLDTPIINWSLLADPNTTFGPDSVRELSSLDFQARGNGLGTSGAEVLEAAEMLATAPVPEPATLLAWGLSATTGLAVCRFRPRHRPA